jgi:hypothetical protein
LSAKTSLLPPTLHETWAISSKTMLSAQVLALPEFMVAAEAFGTANTKLAANSASTNNGLIFLMFFIFEFALI